MNDLFELFVKSEVLDENRTAYKFSVNDDILLPKEKVETLYAIEIVYDAIKTLKVNVHEYKVPDNMSKVL